MSTGDVPAIFTEIVYSYMTLIHTPTPGIGLSFIASGEVHSFPVARFRLVTASVQEIHYPNSTKEDIAGSPQSPPVIANSQAIA